MNRLAVGLGIGFVAGVAIGAGAMQGLQAQSSAPAFYISETTVNDQAAYAPLQTVLREEVKKSPGKFLVQSGKPVAIEGEAATNVTVVQFNSIEEGLAFYNSANMRKWFDYRKPYVTARSFIVQGLAN